MSTLHATVDAKSNADCTPDLLVEVEAMAVLD